MTKRSDNWPAVDAVLIDTSGGDLDFSSLPLRGISIGTAGDLKVDTLTATGIVIPENALATGVQHAICIKKIYQTGTTATEVVGWY